MIIIITTIAALAAVIFGAIQTNKLREAQDQNFTKDAMNKILREHISNVEADLKAATEHTKTLRSELQSCTDKAKAAAVKASINSKSVKIEPVIAAKPKRVYKKKKA